MSGIHDSPVYTTINMPTYLYYLAIDSSAGPKNSGNLVASADPSKSAIPSSVHLPTLDYGPSTPDEERLAKSANQERSLAGKPTQLAQQPDQQPVQTIALMNAGADKPGTPVPLMASPDKPGTPAGAPVSVVATASVGGSLKDKPHLWWLLIMPPLALFLASCAIRVYRTSAEQAKLLRMVERRN